MIGAVVIMNIFLWFYSSFAMEELCQQKLVSDIIAEHKYDIALLSPYCEHIRNINRVIERQGFLFRLVECKNGTRDIRYYNERTNKFLSTISSGEPATIDSVCIEKYDSCMSKGSLLAYVNSRLFNKKTDTIISISECAIASIDYVCANNNETLFICDCFDTQKHKKKIVIDCVNACVIDKYEDYCFAYDSDGLYVREKNNIYTLKIAKDYYVIDKKSKEFYLPQNENIILFASNRTGFFVFVAYDEKENISCVYHDNQGEGLTQFAALKGQAYSLGLVDNGGTLLSCVHSSQSDCEKLWLQNDFYIKEKKEAFLKPFNSQKYDRKEDAVNACGKWFTNDGLLCMRKFLWDNKYTVYNVVTNNMWQIRALGYDHISSSDGEKMICFNEDYQNNTKKTSIVAHIDDNMKNFVQELLNNTLPLVVCTIAKQQAGRIALDDQEYAEYEVLSKSTKRIIDTLYTVTKKGCCAELKGAAYSFYKSIRKPLTAFLFVGSLLGVLFAVSYKYPWMINNNLAKGIELILRL